MNERPPTFPTDTRIQTPPPGAVVPQKPKGAIQPASIRGLLEGEAFKAAVSKALPRHLPPDRFIRIALTALMRTPKLADCDQASFFQALLSLSQMGLEPDGRRAHLIPFENRKRGVVECQLIVDYKGLVDLAMRSGQVSNLHADVVCEQDEFEFDRGQLLHHRINFREARGPVFAAYAICRFKDGQEKCEVMTRAEIEAVRARSRAKDAGPWVTDWSEMAKKSVFRRLSKWLPLSAEFRDALDADADASENRRADVARPVFDATSFLPQQASTLSQALPPAAIAPAPEIEPDDHDATVMPPQPPPPSRNEPPPVPAPVHEQFGAFLASHAISFEALQQWAAETQWEPGFDSYPSLDTLPTRSVMRLLRVRDALVRAIGPKTAEAGL